MPVIENGRYKGKLVKKSEDDDNLFEPHRMDRLEIRFPDLSGATRTAVDFRYITTDRRALGKMLAGQAIAAGAKIFYQHRADGLIGDTDGPLEQIQVRGLAGHGYAELEKPPMSCRRGG
jgi:flavin-dependent dehydrogenase